MDELEQDLERIGGSVDANGDEVPQDQPIENPGGGGGDSSDPVDEPHPDEPGAPSDAGEAPAEPDES
jgi:hypothetical protein